MCSKIPRLYTNMEYLKYKVYSYIKIIRTIGKKFTL